jgi:branched-chain amino acid transport system substrate-binding protein
MRNLTRRGFGVLGVGALGAAPFAAGSAAFSFGATALAQSKEPVKIGVLLGLTGTASVACLESLNSIKLAVEEINRAGGVLGRSIQLVVEDDEGRPNAGIQAANKLSDVDKVPVVIGGYQSSIALPAGKVFNAKRIVFVTDATTNELKRVGPFLFNTAGLADQAAALVDFVKSDKAAAKTTAGLFPNNPIGQDRSAVTKRRSEELGLKYVHAMLYEIGAKDFRPDLNQLMAAKPDAILTDIYVKDAEIIQRQLYETGTTDFAMFYSYNLGAFGTLDAKFTEGMKGIDYATSGIRAEDWTKRYVAAYGKPTTDAWAAPFYDAAWIVAIAINMANSLEPPAIRNAMWPASYLYQGVSSNGDKAFNMLGQQPTDTTYPLSFKGGKMVRYEQPGKASLVTFRYPGEEGVARQFAPSEEELRKYYPEYK